MSETSTTRHEWRIPGEFYTAEELIARYHGSQQEGGEWAEKFYNYLRGDTAAWTPKWVEDPTKCSFCDNPARYYRSFLTRGWKGRIDQGAKPGMAMDRYCQDHYESSQADRPKKPGRVEIKVTICTEHFVALPMSGICDLCEEDR